MVSIDFVKKNLKDKHGKTVYYASDSELCALTLDASFGLRVAGIMEDIDTGKHHIVLQRQSGIISKLTSLSDLHKDIDSAIKDLKINFKNLEAEGDNNGSSK